MSVKLNINEISMENLNDIGIVDLDTKNDLSNNIQLGKHEQNIVENNETKVDANKKQK